MQESRRIYEARMHTVIEYIDQHLDNPLDLNEIAGVAHFSAFHFHRLFAAWMGERLGDYVRRRRLEVAAFRLASHEQSSVLEIALGVGFSSAEAFSRAFKLRFGMAPSSWRQARRINHPSQLQQSSAENSKISQINSNCDQAPDPLSAHNHGTDTQITEMLMQLRLQQIESVPIAYLRHTGPYGAPIAKFWRETVAPWLFSNDLEHATRFGIAHDDPSFTSEMQCRYDAAVECQAPRTLLGHAFKTTLQGGTYAVMPFRGTNAQIVLAWTALFRDWLPESGLQLDAKPCFERYLVDAQFDPVSGIFTCDICLPVIPLYATNIVG